MCMYMYIYIYVYVYVYVYIYTYTPASPAKAHLPTARAHAVGSHTSGKSNKLILQSFCLVK